jgi:class 3 adenylate cyclase
MLTRLDEVNRETGSDLKLRIGIHTGRAVAGVIGMKKFTYDLWGDTVNTASRMESHGVPGRIQLSREAMECVRDVFAFESRGFTDIKGKGKMETFPVVPEEI